MLQIKLEFKNISPLAAKLGKLKQEIDTVTKQPDFLKSVGQLLASRGKQNIEDGGTGGQSYVLLKPATQKQKAKQGFSLKPLQRSGLTKQSIEYEVSGALSMTGLEYIKYHQYGTKNMDQREVFTVESDDMLDIQDFLIRRFEKKIS